MTAYTIPVSNQYPWHKFRVTLSGVVYTLRFRFNNRSNRWEMDIADASDTDILDGIPLLIESDLTYQYRDSVAGLPPGQFTVVDITGAGQQPTLYSFGLTHQLNYVDPDS